MSPSRNVCQNTLLKRVTTSVTMILFSVLDAHFHAIIDLELEDT